MADDGYIATVSGETADWAHWSTKKEALSAAQQSFNEHMWEWKRHVDRKEQIDIEQLIREVDFRLYRLGEECCRVSLPWAAWLDAWWLEYEQSRQEENLRKEIKAEEERLANYLDEWVSDEDEGGVQTFDADKVLEAHRRRRHLQDKLKALGKSERRS